MNANYSDAGGRSPGADGVGAPGAEGHYARSHRQMCTIYRSGKPPATFHVERSSDAGRMP